MKQQVSTVDESATNKEEVVMTAGSVVAAAAKAGKLPGKRGSKIIVGKAPVSVVRAVTVKRSFSIFVSRVEPGCEGSALTSMLKDCALAKF